MITVNAVELAKMVSFAIDGNFPMLITGDAGIGKTDIINQSVLSKGLDLMTLHPVIHESVDYKGLGFRVDRVVNGVEMPTAEFLPFGNLLTMMTVDKPTVVFFDDLGHATDDVQKALTQLLWAREVDGKKISPHIRFMAATNRRQDRAGVKGIIRPLATRFSTTVNLVPDAKSWCGWAVKNGMPPMLVAFIRLFPAWLYKELDRQEQAEDGDFVHGPRPRAWAEVGRAINTGLIDILSQVTSKNDPITAAWKWVAGTIGSRAMHEFYAIASLISEIPDPDYAIAEPETVPLPRSISSLYTLCTAVAYRAEADNLENIIRLAIRLKGEIEIVNASGHVTTTSLAEVAQMMLDDALARTPELAEHPAMSTWVLENPHLYKAA